MTPEEAQRAQAVVTFRYLWRVVRAGTWHAMGDGCGTTPVEKLGEFQTLARSELDVLEFIRLLGVVVSLHDKVLRRVAVAAGVDPVVWDSRRGPIPW